MLSATVTGSNGDAADTAPAGTSVETGEARSRARERGEAMTDWTMFAFIVAGLFLSTTLGWVSGYLHGSDRKHRRLDWAKAYLVQRWNHAHQVTRTDIDVAFKHRPQSKR